MTLTRYIQLGWVLAGFVLGFGVTYFYSRRSARRQLREKYLQFSALHGQVESLEKRLRQLLIDQPRNGQASRQGLFREAWANLAVSSQDSINRLERLHDGSERAPKH